MGKQVYFFMDDKDENYFLDFIVSKEGVLLDRNNMPLTIQEIDRRKPNYNDQEGKQQAISQFYIAYKESSVIVKDNGFIDQIESEIIDVWRCSYKNQNQLWNGRIWCEMKYYDKNGTVIEKPEWLNKRYSELKNWITKKYKLNKTKGFYIGDNAYKLYKEQGFKMMNAPKVMIEFD